MPFRCDLLPCAEMTILLQRAKKLAQVDSKEEVEIVISHPPQTSFGPWILSKTWVRFCLMICKKICWSCIKNTQSTERKHLFDGILIFALYMLLRSEMWHRQFSFVASNIHVTYKRAWEREELKVKGEGGTGRLLVEKDEKNVSQDTPYHIIVYYYSIQQFFHKTSENLAPVMNIVPMHNFPLRKKQTIG